GGGFAYLLSRSRRSLPEKASGVVWANALASLVDLIAATLLLFTIGLVIKVFSGAEESPTALAFRALDTIITTTVDFVSGKLPTLYDTPPALAVAIWYLVYGFAFYVIHRLFHTSRLLWLIAHRSHHVPSVLAGVLAP